MNIRTQTLLALAGLGLVDVFVPVPIVGLLLIYVILQRPPWFAELVRGIYEKQG